MMRSAATASARPDDSDYTFGVWASATRASNWCRLGKAYFGFTDEELLQIDRFVRRNTTEKSDRVPCRALAYQGLVLEVAF